MLRDPKTGAARPALSGMDLLVRGGLSQLQPRVGVVEFERITANHYTPNHWVRLAKQISNVIRSKSVSGAIVTHGTDAIEEVTYFLDRVHVSPKPVVVTGSMLTSDSPQWDGARNLRAAVATVASSAARGRGVVVAFAGRLWAATEVVKLHSTRPDAFWSGEWGPVGMVRRGQPRFVRRSHRLPPLRPIVEPRVEIVVHAIGSDASVVDHWLRRGIRGIVLCGAGAGNVSGQLFGAVERAVRRGVAVAVTTRVPLGGARPLYGFRGGGFTLQHAGALLAPRLTPHKARVELMLSLGNRLSRRAIARNLAFE